MDAIEFRCSTCGKLLRVPAGRAGSSGKCTYCNERVQVPYGAAADGRAVGDETTLNAKGEASASAMDTVAAGKQKRLNGAQVFVLCLGACVLTALLAYPPWRVYKTSTTRYYAGYGDGYKRQVRTSLVAGPHSFIWNPPSEGLIDAYRLIAEAAGIVVLTAAAIIVLRRNVVWVRDKRNLLLTCTAVSLVAVGVLSLITWQAEEKARAAINRADAAESARQEAESKAAEAKGEADVWQSKAERAARIANAAESARQEAESKAAEARKVVRMANVVIAEAQAEKAKTVGPGDDIWTWAAEQYEKEKRERAAVVNKWRQLKNGMTPAEVEAILGEPASTEVRTSLEYWYYDYCGVAGCLVQGKCIFNERGLWEWNSPSW